VDLVGAKSLAGQEAGERGIGRCAIEAERVPPKTTSVVA
jgi:hypothetical protein